MILTNKFFFFSMFLVSVMYIFIFDETLKLAPCIIESNEFMKQLLRKPMNCSVCINLTSIDSVKFINQREFEEKYAYSGRPVVIREAAKNWKAIDVFDFIFFKNLHEMTSMSSCQFINYNEEFNNLEEVFNMDMTRITDQQNETPWYFGWSVCDPSAVSILRQYYEKPFFLSKTSQNYIVDWIFMGTTNYGANLHIDDVRLPSWQAQIKGQKRWIIQPPKECLYTCKEQLTVDVYAGDIIVLDTNLWYHATKVISKEISITIGAEYD